ncbi:MAG: aminotransferase class III-fold pyridoxal phosphate-dependent enzyme [Gammaproteobacteria bacterium]|nr:aminotransferase class III-fold pyridoxal phosphate-dependent enzyme [Gammaproteobacteria bacterium]
MAHTQTLLEKRERLLGPGNPLFYEKPVHLVRGEGVWLFDADGQRYLDCYNNVPCVGHCHPRVVDRLCQQAKLLNTHTRYLHENILDYAEKLLSKFDASLDRVMLACTGSEANELALRVARFNTGGEGVICTNATYHGNTRAVAQLNSIFEPFEGYGDDIRMVPWPDAYRAPDGLQGEALADAYAGKVREAIESFDQAGIRFAGMIVCPIFANEGLPAIPPGYMQKAIGYVRDAGGLYIADEVQAGFGRTGNWWGHQVTGVVPDILTLGKPMGAGHPISGVVARGELIDHYRKHEMYFNTFGGNPVSCAVAEAVLDVIEDERLVENAASVGRYVFDGFRGLQEKHDIIGDVRGNGLFFGIYLVTDRRRKTPAPAETKRIVNRLREKHILMSNIGEHDNVLKLRPPLCFSTDNADQLIGTLDDVLSSLQEQV